MLLIEICSRPLALKGLNSNKFDTIGRYWFRLIDKYVNLLIVYEAIQFPQGLELHKDYAALLQPTGKVDTSAADVGAETGEC